MSPSELVDRVAGWRPDLHRCPEVGFQEHRTSAYVAQVLTGLGADGARNAIPGEVVITGDTRSFDPAVQALLEDRIRALCAGICAAHGATCTVTYTHEFEPTVNDAACTERAVAAALAVAGADRVDGSCLPFMGSEDFGAFGRAVPACFTFIGNGLEAGRGGTPLHSRDYDFNDDVLDTGARFYVELARSVLPAGGTT
jgi:hippurate hydrolase